MVLWIKTTPGRVVPMRAPFTPVFYVAGPRARLERMATALPLLPGVGAPELEMRLLGLAPGHRRVLKVPVRDMRRLASVARTLDAEGEHRDHALYDVDLRVSQRFLLEHGLFPFARVRGGSMADLETLDDMWDLDYEMPALVEIRLEARVRGGGPAVRPEDPVASVRLDDETIEGPEEEVLRETARLVARRDPDVVCTRGGDRWMLPHLAHRARERGLEGWTLGRDARLEAPARRGKSFFSYGKIKYRAPVHPIVGRMHVDLDESFFFGEGGLPGLVDLSRLSGIPLAELARLEAGTAVTSIQIGEAKRQGRLIPWKKNLPEKPKTLRQLVAADRGGYIFDPRVGLHEDVFELDFAGLYPTLIANHNLGSETILCSCCDPRALAPDAFVPQVGYHVCVRRRGLVPTVLEKLVKRREELKRRRKTDPARLAEYQRRVDALKWLNVVSFGYQGYRNARFGCIEAHEATCAWAREAILAAGDVAKEEGYRILHGIVDSLYVQRERSATADVERLAERVEREVGIRFEPQGRYKWIVFLPTRAHDAAGAPAIGAPNRFYGCFDKVPDAPSRSQAGQDVDHIAGGAVKVRGVELRQGSVPRVVSRAQEVVLEVLALADDAAAFRALVPEAIEAARPVLRRLRQGDCTVKEVEIELCVTRGLDGRTQMNHGHAALRQLARRGVEVSAGDKVRFIVTDAASRDPETRVRELRLLREGEAAYDVRAYETLLLRALASLLLPVGYDEARLAEALKDGPRQTRLATA